MDKLKRYRHGARNGVMTPDPEGPFVRYEDVAAALEAAREDAERLDSGTIRIIERDEFGMQHTTAYSGVDLRAAIDQARGKGGKEDSND